MSIDLTPNILSEDVLQKLRDESKRSDAASRLGKLVFVSDGVREFIGRTAGVATDGYTRLSPALEVLTQINGGQVARSFVPACFFDGAESIHVRVVRWIDIEDLPPAQRTIVEHRFHDALTGHRAKLSGLVVPKQHA